MTSYNSDGCLPFYDDVEVWRWVWPNGDRLTIEKDDAGYFVSGVFGGRDWHNGDHEDFYCRDTDELLDFLREHGFLTALGGSGPSS